MDQFWWRKDRIEMANAGLLSQKTIYLGLQVTRARARFTKVKTDSRIWMYENLNGWQRRVELMGFGLSFLYSVWMFVSSLSPLLSRSSPSPSPSPSSSALCFLESCHLPSSSPSLTRCWWSSRMCLFSFSAWIIHDIVRNILAGRRFDVESRCS